MSTKLKSDAERMLRAYGRGGLQAAGEEWNCLKQERPYTVAEAAALSDEFHRLKQAHDAGKEN